MVYVLGEEGEADLRLDGCGCEGDAPWEWLNVTSESMATGGERKRSDGRIPFDKTNPRPGPHRVWRSKDLSYVIGSM